MRSHCSTSCGAALRGLFSFTGRHYGTKAGEKPTVHMSLPDCHALCCQALCASGLQSSAATAVANVITAAERDMAKSHGLFRLPGFCRSLRSGRVPGHVELQIEERGPSILHLDGKGCFSPVALAYSLPHLVSKTREHGVAILSIAGALHFSALWWEAEEIAKAGLIGIVVVNSLAFVAPHGGHHRVFGTNPMAFAWPRPGGDILVWDQASSVMARGDMTLHMLEGKELPAGAAIDFEGRPTTDPTIALQGAQCTFGGAKGSNVALMVELLAAGLTGGTLSSDTQVPPEANHPGGAPTANGELLIAINPAQFPGGTDHAERLFEALEEEAEWGARLPGSRRHTARARTGAEGINVLQSTYDAIQPMLQPP